jgi:hypothetical protein
MSKFYLISGLAALAFFSYAQHQGMTLTGSRGVQQLASNSTGGSGSGGSGRSSTLSHK